MTFTFTIDCLPAYTKFNKKKKVMAVLQVVDKTDTTHNYKNTAVRGHENRTKVYRRKRFENYITDFANQFVYPSGFLSCGL